MTIYCFPPAANKNARILILGTMPGKVSLLQQQYYAHPQNLFWRLSAEVLGFDVAAPYPNRLQSLMSQGVALWDVLQSCTRSSSLDSDIEESSVIMNNFTDFFFRHPHVRLVCFNGAKAASLFARRVRPQLAQTLSLQFQFLALPSTSPANASISWAQKLRAWSSINAMPKPHVALELAS